MKHIKIIILFLFIIILIGCSKDDNIVNSIENTESSLVYVVNEGNFMKGNASLSLYMVDSNRIVGDIFQTVNGKKLGDVAQNMYINSGKGYIVVNNSNKIVIIDIKTNKIIDTLTTKLNSPRSICFILNKMYISNLYGSSITILNGENYKTFVKEISVKPNPDEMIISNNKIFCCNASGYNAPSTNLAIIDPSTDLVAKNLKIGYNPIMIKTLDQNTLVILCSGEYNDYTNPNDDIFAKLFIVNSSTDVVMDSIAIGGHPYDFTIDSDGNAYILGETSVIKLNVKTKTISNSNFIPGMYYSIDFEPSRKELYISDAKDFVSTGDILVYDLNGAQKKKFQAGIIPGAFCFHSK
jgi:DNA-binding beta-propeller fold protein YncE